MEKNKKDLTPLLPKILPILFCLVLVVIIYYPIFFKGYWAVNRSDVLNVHLSNNYAIVETFRQGKFPLWNPNFNLGQPTIDGTTTIFHPALIFYLLFNPWLANTVEVLVGLVLTCLGIWCLLRQQRFEIFPAAIGSLIYVLSGPVFFLHSYHLGFIAILLLPWCLWVFHQHDRTGHPKYLWLSAVLCILAVQSLDSDTLFYLYTGLIIDRLACIPMHQRRLYVTRWIPILLLSGLTGLLLFLPLYEWLLYSSRITKSYAGILNPNFLNMAVAMFTNQWLTRWSYDSFYFYFGSALIWLALAGLVKFDRATYVFRYFLWSLAMPGFYILMRFLQGGYLNPLGSLDVWRGMFVFCLGLGMVSAIGIQNILKETCSVRKISLIMILLTISVVVWGFVKGRYTITNLTILVGTAVGILTATFSRKITSRMFGISIMVIAISILPAMGYVTKKELCIIHRNSRFIKNLPFYQRLAKTPNGQDGHWRVSTFFRRTDNTTSLAGVRTIPNYSAIYNKAMEQALSSAGLIQSNSTHPYWMELIAADAQSLSLCGVRFLISVGDLWPEKNKVGWTERPELSWCLYRVWENKYYLGRAYLVTPSGERRGGVKFLQDKQESVILQAEAEDDDRLVLADLYYPGWEAQVDGENVPVEVYHGCLRSIKLSKGRHIVRWQYNGRLQRAGMVLSIIVLFFLAVFLVFLSFKRRLSVK